MRHPLLSTFLVPLFVLPGFVIVSHSAAEAQQNGQPELPVIKQESRSLSAADEVGRDLPKPNKYDMNDRRNYKFGYLHNYRPPAQWTPNPPSAGPHHYKQYRNQWRLRGSFGPYVVQSPTPGYPPVLVTPERGAIVMPPIY